MLLILTFSRRWIAFLLSDDGLLVVIAGNDRHLFLEFLAFVGLVLMQLLLDDLGLFHFELADPVFENFQLFAFSLPVGYSGIGNHNCDAAFYYNVEEVSGVAVVEHVLAWLGDDELERADDFIQIIMRYLFLFKEIDFRYEFSTLIQFFL